MQLKHILLSVLALTGALGAAAQNLPNLAQTAVPGSFSNMTTPTETLSPTGLTNSVITYAPWIPVTDTASLNTATAGNVTLKEGIYTDGFNRPYQSIKWNATTVNNVRKHQVQVYDNRILREQYAFLPYATTNAGVSATAFQEQRSFYNGLYPDEGYSAFTMTTNTSTTAERSATNYAAGKSQVGLHVGTVTRSVTNPASQVLIWNLDANGAPVTAGYYAAGELTGTEAAGPDANGNNSGVASPRSRVYKDREGNVILKLSADSSYTQTSGSQVTAATTYTYTYYVYDVMGRLRCTITPKAYKYYLAQGSLPANALNNLCFRYLYDAKGRLYATRKPGEDDYTYVVYDRKDRPVMRQTPNERAANEWEVAFMDALGRTKVTGIYKDVQTTPLTQAGWQNLLDTWTSGGAYADLAGYLVTPALEPQYPVGNNPLADPAGNAYSAVANYTVMTIQYYDRYDRLGTAATLSADIQANVVLPSITAPGLEDPAVGRSYGMPTGSIVRILRSPSALSARAGDWNTSVSFYDDKGRMILGKTTVTDAANNNAAVHNDYTAQQYDFAGRLLLSGHRFSHAGSQNHAFGDNHIEFTRNQFDAYTGALVKATHKLDDHAWATIATYLYDDLGRLARKTLGSGGEVQDMSYNLRGQLTGINGVYAETANKGGYSKSFGESLKYDYGFTQNRLDGRIAGMVWRGSSTLDRYAYGYDYTQNGMLKRADFTHTESGAWAHATMDYSVSNLFYDKNGNILSMKQRGVKPGIGPVDMDNLVYTYNSADMSNRLKQVTDNGYPYYGAGDYKGSDNHFFDANGNLSKQTGTKGLQQITYTRFNKPITISFADGSSIEYSYDAAGNKVEELVSEAGKASMKRTDYVGNVVYQYTQATGSAYTPTDSLQYISTGEGRTVFNDNLQPREEFFVKDHLGNVRSIIQSAGYDLNTYLATYELASAHLENLVFDGIEQVRDDRPGGSGDNTMAARLNGIDAETRVGTSLLVHVMAGDKVGLSVNTYYDSYDAQNENPVDGEEIVNQLVNTLMGGEGGIGGSEAHDTKLVGDLFTYDNMVTFNNLVQTSTDASKPKAYLNYVLFDENMNYVRELSGVFQATGSGQWAVIGTSSDMEIPVSGYLAVYLSNASVNLQCNVCSDVYFDQLEVRLSHGTLQEENHYYPYGLPIFGLGSRTTSTAYRNNRKKFQANEYITEAGLNWMSFGARQYDPQIGRFLSVDPLAALGGQDRYSPYAAMGNQPESAVDPMGLMPSMTAPSGVRVEAASAYGGENAGGFGSDAWTNGSRGGGGNPINEDLAWAQEYISQMVIQNKIAAAIQAVSLAFWSNVGRTFATMTGEKAELDENGNIKSQMSSNPSSGGKASMRSSREAYQGNNGTGNAAYVKKSNIVIDGTKGGMIQGYQNFYNFMLDQANLNSVEVAAWKLQNNEDGSESYFILPWVNNAADESRWNLSFFDNAGYYWNSYVITGDYHTHPHSTGPSLTDSRRTAALGINYQTYTIGADGRIWNTWQQCPGVPSARFVDIPGGDPNYYRYGTVIYDPKQ